MDRANPSINIIIADDHPMLREGVASVINPQPDMRLVGEAEDGEEAIALFRRLQPDITLMDLQMPKVNGIDAITIIRKDFPSAKIIVLTTYSGDVQALRALKAGAAGYLLKSSLRKELLETIRLVHGGRRHLPAQIATEIAVRSLEEGLSPREVEVLRLVSTGNANKLIAYKLAISEDSVKAHMKSIFVKLDVTDRTYAVIIAARRGIIDL